MKKLNGENKEKSEFQKYKCKIASMEEVVAKMDYEISMHPDDKRWKLWKEEAKSFLEKQKRICYIGILEKTIICEATVALSEDAAQNLEDLIDDNTVYLFAFRTNEEYRNKGYFSKLYKFMEEDLKNRGYTRFILGVEPTETENLEIYKHFGFRKFVKEAYEKEPVIDEKTEPEKVLVHYYLKEI